MFYILAKLLWFIVQPSSMMVLSVALSLVLSRMGRTRAAGTCLSVALGLGLIAWSPLPRVLAMPLENRFPRADLDGRPVTGILLLGGGELADIYFHRNGAHGLSDAGERITETVVLALKLPRARIAVIGGSEFASRGGFENNVMAQMLIGMGVPKDRLELEVRSRDTWENAVFASQVLKPKPDERWLLVTSAWHMPRAMGSFRKNGFPVEAWPVDYRTAELADAAEPFFSPSEGFTLLDLITREYIGLASYRLAGRSDDLFPAP